jgi:hypothetical protein
VILGIAYGYHYEQPKRFARSESNCAWRIDNEQPKRFARCQEEEEEKGKTSSRDASKYNKVLNCAWRIHNEQPKAALLPAKKKKKKNEKEEEPVKQTNCPKSNY